MFIMKMPSSATPRSTSSAATRSLAGTGVALAATFGSAAVTRTTVPHRRAVTDFTTAGPHPPRAKDRDHVRDRHRRQPAQALVACRDRKALARMESERRRARARQGRRDPRLAQGPGRRRHRHRRRRRAVAPAFRARLPGASRRHRLRAQGEDGHPRQPLRRDGAAGGRAACASPAGSTRAKRAWRGRTPRRSSSSPCPGR